MEVADSENRPTLLQLDGGRDRRFCMLLKKTQTTTEAELEQTIQYRELAIQKKQIELLLPPNTAAFFNCHLLLE